MNNPTTNNLDPTKKTNDQSNPEDLAYYNQTQQEESQIEQTANELMYSTYEQLLQKYGDRVLSEKVLKKLPVTGSNVIEHVSMLKYLFILNFVPGENIFQITAAKKNAVVELIAQVDPATTKEQIDQKLKAIDPTFSVPEEFQLSTRQLRAQELFNAHYNIKNIIANSLVPEYLSDTMHFVNMPGEQVEQYSEKLRVLSKKIEQEYDKLLNHQPIGSEVIDEAINFLAKTGRTALFIQELREDKNLGDLTDLILKIDTASKIVSALRENNPSGQLTEDEIKVAIKNYMMQNMGL